MYEAYSTAPLLSTAYFYGILNDIYGKMKIDTISKQYTSVEPAIKFIENNYFENITVSQLAQICNYSESSLYKLFQSATGVTPIQYKHNIMIQHSLDMLANTELSIEEISSKAGFSSSNYFRKVFYKLTDKTPKEIRKTSP